MQSEGLGLDPGEAQVLHLALADLGEALPQRAAPQLTGAAARHDDGRRQQAQADHERQRRQDDRETHSGSFARLWRRGGTRMEFGSRTTEWRTRNAVQSSSSRAMATRTNWPPPWKGSK